MEETIRFLHEWLVSVVEVDFIGGIKIETAYRILS